MTAPQRDVLVVGNYLPDRQYSMQRFADGLVEGLHDQGLSADLIRPEARFGRLAEGPGRAGKWFGYLDKYVLFPLALRRRARRYRIVHIADHSNAPYRTHTAGRPTLLTCHDLFAVRSMLGEFEDQRLSVTGVRLQRWILRSVRGFRTIACVSEATADDVRRLAPGVPQVCTIPNVVDPVFAPVPDGEARARLRALGLDADRGYFLQVGGNDFYKNRPGTVALFDGLAGHPACREHRLVLAGKRPDGRVEEALARSPYRDRIDVVVEPSDADVRALYTRATALLFPSWREGFGWPVLEAQACGCPVVTTDAEPMRSIAGGAAVLIDPADVEDVARRVVAALGRSDELRARGFANVEGYRPAAIYPRYAALYRDLAR